jgi:polyhydroxyalkanoate synthase
MTDIRAPIFTVATEQDHVAPWRSVYKINLLADADEVTFLLTSGGHNAGIVSEPGHRRRSYQMACRIDQDRYIDPDTWQATTTPKQSGSWWPTWESWLVKHSMDQQAPPASAGYAGKRSIPTLWCARNVCLAALSQVNLQRPSGTMNSRPPI